MQQKRFGSRQFAGISPSESSTPRIALIAARASVSMVVPPLGAAGREGACQVPTKRRTAPRARSYTTIPGGGVRKVQLPPIHAASLPDWPTQAPLAPVATSQVCPSRGLVGGAAKLASTAQWTSASIRAASSLTVISFCAWAPGMAVLGPAQAFRLARRIKRGERAVGPVEAA